MSSLSWIVFDEAERQRARRIMALFEAKETRDELGLGAIRDSIADHLFPGTSTIQTRLRYMLFVPWIYEMIGEIDAPPDQLMELARANEVRLIEALRIGGEEEGVIGRIAGSGLKRLPSSIYWNGLRSWGIRLFSGSQEAYFEYAHSLHQHLHSVKSKDEHPMREGHLSATWCTSLPSRPDDLLEQASFHLTEEEANFLIDRVVLAQQDSLLAHLAKAGRHVECNFIWEHPDFAEFPRATRKLVKHAEVFSALMHGASLLYNLLLAEKRENEEWIERYQGEISHWKESSIDRTTVNRWSLNDFWDCIRHKRHRIRKQTRYFVHNWRELVNEHDGDIINLNTARDLVRTRERRLKRSQSRFDNRAVLDNWGGESGISRLNFRWYEASNHIRDLVNAG